MAAVAWSHWAPARPFGLPFGSGVQLFYVISGYLITSILLRVRAQDDRGSGLRVFYLRRVLRIFPAFYLTLALAAAFDLSTVRDSWTWHAAYLSNVQLYRIGFASPVSHFWSLAVEEQFYLVWPWVVVFAPSRFLMPICVAAIAATPVAHVLIRGLGASELLLWTPVGSFDALGAGALIALAEGGLLPHTWPRARVVRALAMIGIPVWLAMIAFNAAGGQLPLVPWAAFHFAQALAFGAIVATAARGIGGVVGQALESRIMVALGRISYGIYLVHVFAPRIVRAALLHFSVDPLSLRAWAIQPLFAIVTIALAAASWLLIEGPINRQKDRFPYTRRRVSGARFIPSPADASV